MAVAPAVFIINFGAPMTTKQPFTYVLVGHVTKDLHQNGNFSIGGTVTYATAVVKKLDWRPVVITTAAPDFEPIPFLRDVKWHVLPSPATTTFRNVYNQHGHRQQTVGPVAAPIRAADIPASCRQASLIHLCPLTQELEPDIATAFGDARLTATPQGWLRQWDEQGRVSLGNWHHVDQLLPKLHTTVISIEDVEQDWSIAEDWASRANILVVTQGESGCTIFAQGDRISVPPRPAQPVDPTGAGDVFAAAFFIRYFETNDLRQSARFANVTASMAIERNGPAGVPDRAEVEQYLAQHPV
ncbi:MAG: Sulfofructose kinase [Anaerolineae bacterium]|nr:Sulfofructose kinase [Anaerolineae bacterium]